MSFWLKNSGGKPDAMFTLAVASWCVSTFLLLGMLIQGEVKIGDNISFTLNPPDATLVLGYLGATFTSYVIRRNKKDQLQSEEEQAYIENGILPGE